MVKTWPGLVYPPEPRTKAWPSLVYTPEPRTRCIHSSTKNDYVLVFICWNWYTLNGQILVFHQPNCPYIYCVLSCALKLSTCCHPVHFSQLWFWQIKTGCRLQNRINCFRFQNRFLGKSWNNFDLIILYLLIFF